MSDYDNSSYDISNVYNYDFSNVYNIEVTYSSLYRRTQRLQHALSIHRERSPIQKQRSGITKKPKKTFISETCVICLDTSAEITITLSPCGHKCLCKNCKSHINIFDNCPLCRQEINNIIVDKDKKITDN